MAPSDLLPDLSGFGVLVNLRDLAFAYALAFMIGWNREREERSAGLRTFPLVAVAACGFVQAAEGMAGDDPQAMMRVVEGVIAGMGFIGGGAILKTGSEVQGTATAAALWATGAIGVAVGLGAYDVAVVVNVCTVVSLYVLRPLKSRDRP